MNEAKRIEVGKRYRIPYDYEWEGISPFRGLEVTVLEITGFSKAGFDCFARVHVTPEELAARYSVQGGKQATVKEIIEWHGHKNFTLQTDPGVGLEPGLYLEHETEHLESILYRCSNDLAPRGLYKRLVNQDLEELVNHLTKAEEQAKRAYYLLVNVERDPKLIATRNLMDFYRVALEHFTHETVNILEAINER